MTKAQRKLLRTLSQTPSVVKWSRTLEALTLADYVVLRETPRGLVAVRGCHMSAHPELYDI